MELQINNHKLFFRICFLLSMCLLGEFALFLYNICISQELDPFLVVLGLVMYAVESFLSDNLLVVLLLV